MHKLAALVVFLDSSAVKIVEISEDAANAYARVFKVLRANGTPIPQNDLWIAACAVDSAAVVYSLDEHFGLVPLLERKSCEIISGHTLPAVGDARASRDVAEQA